MAVSCTSHKISEVPAFIFGGSVYRVEKDGVVIGVDLYIDSKRIEDAFHVDMSKGGFIPIRMSISNLTDDRLVIDRSEIYLIAESGDQYAAVSSEDVVKELRHNSAVYGHLGFGIFSFMSAEEANEKMRADWSSKELPPSMFFGRGQKHIGFAYFKLPENILPTSTVLQVTAENFMTGAQTTLLAGFAARN